MSTIKIYTDKSSCKGGVGATAVLFINGTQRRVLQYYLGTDKTHTLYKAEIVGMILAATMLQEYGFLDGVAIGIDNQGVIKAISSWQGGLRQHLINYFLQQLQQIAEQCQGVCL